MSFNSKAYLEYEEQRHDEHDQYPRRTGKPSNTIPTLYAAQLELQKAIDSMTPEEWEAELQWEKKKFNQD
jgi:hypothetical protein